jgi:hypothetical protein
MKNNIRSLLHNVSEILSNHTLFRQGQQRPEHHMRLIWTILWSNYILLFFTILVLAGGGALLIWRPISPHTAPMTYYEYEDYSSFLPERLPPGGRLTITWRAYPDTSSPSARKRTPITLSILLVSKQAFGRDLCGAYSQAILLDILQISNTSSQQYSRPIQIPLHTPPGRYELVRQRKEAGIAFCVSGPLLISSAAISANPQARRQ